MPSAEKAPLPRVVLDESSLNFRGLSDEEIGTGLADLIDTIQDVKNDHGQTTYVAPMLDYVECLDSCELYQLLSREYESDVDVDARRRAFLVLSKCPEWEPPEPNHTDVSIDGRDPVMAFSVGYALGLAQQRHGVACLTFGGAGRSGLRPVSNAHHEAQLHFFRRAVELPAFWRYLFRFEHVEEKRFFALAALAFPRLELHPDLSFGRFEGNYTDLRERVVTILAGLSDHFATEFVRCRGLPRDIQAALSIHQIDLSPESPKTRASTKLMHQRDVIHNGTTFSCEWHAKLEPHRNRIHFSAPSPELKGKILIGLFIRHLPT